MHVPHMTILHHVHMGKPLSDRMEAQYAYAKRQYAEKHFSRLHRFLFLSLIGARHRLRLLTAALPGSSRFRPEADRWALQVLAGEQAASVRATAVRCCGTGRRDVRACRRPGRVVPVARLGSQHLDSMCPPVRACHKRK